MNNQSQHPVPVDPMTCLQPTAPYSQQMGYPNMNYTIMQYKMPDYKYTEALLQYQAENIKLKNRLEQKILKEEELKQVLQMQGDAYFSTMASGRAVQLTHFIFEKVAHIVYDPLYDRKTQIQVKVSVQEKPDLIDWDDFWNDKKWLAFLEQISRTKITIYGSVKRVAVLLRSIANECMAQCYVPYLGGWVRRQNSWYYYTFSGFQTSA